MLCALESQEEWLAKAEATIYLCLDPESVSKEGKDRGGLGLWVWCVCLIASDHSDLKQ